MKRIRNASVLVLSAALIAGCAKVPQEAIESTSLMMEDAKMQEADVFAPELFSAAEDSFEAARVEIELQNAKFGLLRSYDHASELLADATQLAREASESAVVNKQEMRTETEQILIQAQGTADQARLLLSKAPRGKEGRIALVAIGSDVDSLNIMFTEVQDLLAAGNVKAAHELAQASLHRAEGLTNELQRAIEKTTSRGRG